MTETVQLRDLFAALAGDVDAMEAHPAPDGSLLLRFQEAVVAWHPLRGRGRHVYPGLDGSFSCKGLTPDDLRRVMERLARVTEAHRVRNLRPFSVRGDDDPVTLGPGLLDGPLGDYLEEGVTRWGSYLLVRARSRGPATLRLDFTGGDGGVAFEVSKVAKDDTAAAGPVRVDPVDDERGEPASDPSGDAVDDYVRYAVSRVFVGGRPVGRAAPSERSTRRDREVAEAPLSDPRDESPPDAFFVGAKDRGQGTFEAAATLLDSDPGVAVLLFSHPFCLSKMAFVDRADLAGAMWHRFAALPLRARHVERISAPTVGELDLVMGDEEKFRAPIREAASRPETRVIAVISTCITELIGLDLDGIVAEALGDRGIPVIFWHARPHAGTSMAELWGNLMVLADRDLAPILGTVNLLGLVHDESDTAAELRAALGAVGVQVGAFLGPGFRTEAARRFTEAECTVVSTDPLVRAEFEGLRDRFPAMRFRDAPPPFGPAGTRAFLEEVGGETAAGRPSMDTLDALWAPHRSAWSGWRERASRHGVAFVVRPSDRPYVEGGAFYGMNLISLVREMGFRVHVACIPGPGGDHRETAEHLDASLAKAFPGDDGVVVEVPRWQGSVQALRSLPVSLVFTEYPPDRRILDAGRIAFQPRDFEMGFEGALRTVRRLVRSAESGFASALPPRVNPEEDG